MCGLPPRKTEAPGFAAAAVGVVLVNPRDFKAYEECPKCSAYGWHWLEPVQDPVVLVPSADRRGVSYVRNPRTELNPEWATVDRQCVECGFRWAER